MFELQHADVLYTHIITYIYIYLYVYMYVCIYVYVHSTHVITSVYFRVGGIACHPKNRSERLPAANVSQGYSARRSRNAEMAYLQAWLQVFKQHPFLHWPNLNGKGSKL